MKRCMGCMGLYEDQYDVCPHCGYEEGFDDHQLLHIEAGQMLADRYIVGRSLGFGGFGVTYLGWDTKLQRKIAIKEYLPSEFATRYIHHQEIVVDDNEKKNQQFKKGKDRFLKEGEKLAQVGDIDGIVHMYDSFECNNTAYITMEYLEGMTLTEYLNDKGAMNEQEVMDLILPIFKALETVHEKGIIHRDIAPDNLFVTIDEDGNKRLKLIDFGASKFASTSHSKSLTVMIKPGYSPEEQYRSNGDQGTYTDVYALAAVMYKMVTGLQLPDSFERRTAIESHKKDLLVEPDKYNKSLSDNFVTALMNALNVRIEDRTKTVSEFENELVSFEPVKRRGNSIRKIDFLRWPLWAKIGVPLASLAAVGLVVFAITKVFSRAAEDYSLPKGYTRVPDFVEADFDTQAMEWAKEANVIIEKTDTRNSSKYPKNLVLSQQKPSGSVVNEKTVIGLTISSGEEIFVMPDVRGMRLEDAQRALKCMEVEVNTIPGTQDGLVLDGVISQDIAAYGEINSGSSVTLTVNTSKSASLNRALGTSTGKKDDDSNSSDNSDDISLDSQKLEEMNSEAPQIEGLDYEEALQKVYEQGWTLFVSSRTAGNGADEGTVLSQRIYPDEDGKKILEVTTAMPNIEVELPDLTLKDQSTARQLLNNLGIEVKDGQEYNETIAKGLVISQDRLAKSTVKPGEVVVLTVSLGSEPFDMPKLTDTDEENARKIAQKNNLIVNFDYTNEGNLPEGTVISQSINNGEKVTRGTAVTVLVFSKKDIVEVPNVEGLKVEEAKKKLSDQGFDFQIEEQESSFAKNSIISQQPSAGSQQKKGAKILLIMSVGGWTEWSAELPPAGAVLEEKTQYRARNKEVMTSDSPSSPGAGWSLEKTEFTGWTEYIPGITNSETPIAESDEVKVTGRTQERHRELVEKTTESPLDSSWELISNTDKSHWGDWSDWSDWSRTNDTSLPSSNSLTEVDVEHHVFYGWYYFTCPKCGNHSPNWNINCSNCNTYIPYMNGVSQVWTYDDVCPDGYYFWANGDDGSNDHCRYRTRSWIDQHIYQYRKWSDWSGWADTNSIPSDTSNMKYEIRTVYDSEVRSKKYTYTFERWTDWSDYSDDPVTGDEVQKRSLYRYRTGD